jgi:hypothetical protein
MYMQLDNKRLLRSKINQQGLAHGYTSSVCVPTCNWRNMNVHNADNLEEAVDVYKICLIIIFIIIHVVILNRKGSDTLEINKLCDP